MDQVVRPDAEEIDFPRELLRLYHCAGGFHHDAHRQVAFKGNVRLLKILHRVMKCHPCLTKLHQARDKREHDAHVAMDRDAEDRTKLNFEHFRVLQ